MAAPATETVIKVHDTWATPDTVRRRWYEPADGRRGGEPSPEKLDAALQERGSSARCWAHCRQGNPIFQWWPGENSWIARTNAASALARYVIKLQNEGWRCHIVAHSHGGNVLLEALLQLKVTNSASEELQGKLVTLGTPFMDTTSALTEKVEWRQKNIITTSLILSAFMYLIMFALLSLQRIPITIGGVAWVLLLVYGSRRRRSQHGDFGAKSRTGLKYWFSEGSFWIVASFLIGSLLLALLFVFSAISDVVTCQYVCIRWIALIKRLAIAALLIGALNAAYRVPRKIGGSDKFILCDNATNQASPLLLAIGSRTDEAWQILHHLGNIDNPLAIKGNLLGYLFLAIKSAISQNVAVARFLGAKTYRDIGTVAMFATAVMHLLTLPYRSSNRTARRGMPGPRPPTTLGRRDNWTMAGRRLSPYCSSGITNAQAAGIHEFCTTNRYRARKRLAIQRDCIARLPRTTEQPAQELMILNVPPLPGALLAIQLSRTRL
jgi:hypothetical protein